MSTLCSPWKYFEGHFGSTSGLLWKYLRGYCWIILVSFWNHCKGRFESTLGSQGKYLRGHCGTFGLFSEVPQEILEVFLACLGSTVGVTRECSGLILKVSVG